MIVWRLAVADLRSSWRVWSGLFVVCAVGAVAASVPGVLVVGGLRTTGVRGLALLSIAGTTAAFGIIAVLVVVSAVVRLTAGLLGRTYALWQLVGVTPRGVRWTVLLQTTLVALVGTAAGAAVSVVAVPPLVTASLAGASGLGDVEVGASRWEVLAVVAVTVVVAVGAAVSGSRRAAATPPLVVLRSTPPAPGSRGLRAVVAVSLGALATSMLVGLPGSVPDGAAPALLIGPVLVAAVAVLGRSIGAPAVRAWTAVVPTSASVAFGVARATVRWSAARSDTTLAALLVAVGLPSALVGGQRTAASAIGSAVSTGGGAGATVLILSGPVLLAAIGAAATAAMAARDRVREGAQLRAAGASPGFQVGVAAFEGLILGLTGTLVAAATVLVTVVAEWAVLVGAHPATRPELPVAVLLSTGAFCTLLVVGSSVLPVLGGLRPRAVTP